MATRKKSGGRKSSSRKSSSRKSSSRKSGRKGAAKKGGRKTRRKSSSSGRKRTPNAAFMKPMQPSSDLASVVGSGAMPRTEVTKKLWQYIKRKGLQDSKNRRMINADENLRPIFGGSRQVSMFEMTRLVNKHLRNT